MFRKLVSNVSFSPALVGQLGFYAHRLKKEEATRRVGLIFTALALVVQSFAVFSAPEPANAASTSDMIRGGVSSKTELMQHYDANTNSIKTFYSELGITREELRTTTAGTLNSKSDVLSWGMRSQFSASKGERSYTVKNSNGTSTTFYSRPLDLWDSTSYTKANGSTYQVYVGHSKKFGWFAIIKNCGNLVTKDHPKPPAPKPQPSALCRSLDTIEVNDTTRRFKATAEVRDGAKISKYSFTVKDSAGKVAKSAMVNSTSGSVTTDAYAFAAGSYTVDVAVTTTAGVKTGQNCRDSFTIAQPGISITKTVNGKQHLAVEIDQEFTYEIAVSNTGETTLNNAVVSDPAPANVSMLSSSKGEIKDNKWSYTIPRLSPGQSERFTIKAKVTSTDTANTRINNTACVDTPTIPGSPDDCDNATVQPPAKKLEVCDIESGQIITITAKEYDSDKHSTDIDNCAAVVTSKKSAVNITQSGKDASTTTAQPSDRITYSLTMNNTGQQSAEAKFVEQLDDVVEYATVIDTGGGDYDKDAKTLTWPAVTLGAGEEATRMFTVQLASTTPSAARGISDKTSYDCIMLNTFGNSVEVKVECGTPKQVEQVVSELPYTGPTENIAFAGILLSIVTFFYARSRQLGTEVRLVRRSINTGAI